MGHKSSKIPALTPRRTAECKVLVYGSDWLASDEVLRKLTDGEVPLAEGWSTNPKTQDKFVDVFPWFNGGRCDDRAIFRSLYGSADAFIFLFNRHSKNDLEYSRFMLEMLIKEEGLENAVVVVLANDRRYDIEDNSEQIEEKTEDELKEAIGFNDIPLRNKPIYLNCCAKTGDGLDKVVEYLTKQLLSDTQGERPVEKVPEVTPQVVKSSMIKQVLRSLKWIKPSVPKTA